jgi:hypothetical protein
MGDHPWIKRGPYPGLEHTGMPIPDDPVVGHKTFQDGHHEPLRQSEAAVIIAASEAAKARRAEQMPDDKAAIHALFDAWLRLKELGWNDAQYCPKDGSLFDAIEVGSTGVHRCRYEGQWPSGSWLIDGDDDLYPSRPVLFRTTPTAGAAMITRIEYQSSDSRRSATVLMVGVCRWSVLLREHRRTGPRARRLAWAKTLTSAQGMARGWCQRARQP